MMKTKEMENCTFAPDLRKSKTSIVNANLKTNKTTIKPRIQSSKFDQRYDTNNKLYK